MPNETHIQDALDKLPALIRYLQKYSRDFEPFDIRAIAEDALTTYLQVVRDGRFRSGTPLAFMRKVAIRNLLKILGRRKLEDRYNARVITVANSQQHIVERFETLLFRS